VPPTEGDDRMKNWTAILILAAAQFVMVLDSSVMNVSISQIVADLDTTIQGVQLAITAYTLVMAAFMLTGAKLGDIWGRDRTFAIGLVVYATGSLITSLSPNLTVLLIGWSLIEGLGAVLVVPAIAALIAANYEGKERALAYGLIGGVAAAAVAVGPIIGGWVTTNFTWRYVFVGEVVIVAVILLVRNRMQKSPTPENPPKLDLVGAALSASGFGFIVFGILQSSSWGWVQPKGALTINGTEITPLGFSIVPFLILGGLGLLATLSWWVNRRQARGEAALLDMSMLSIRTLRAGLSTLVSQQLVLMGTFFVLPVYLQVVLGLDAFNTGLKLLPMSVTMFLAALLGPRVAARRSPRRVAQASFVLLALGSVIILGTIDIELNSVWFALGLAVFGIGIGGLASQLGNVIMSSVDPAQTNQAGGLQGTAQNLGASLGTALIGAILLGGLTASFVDRIADNPALTAEQQAAVTDYVTETGLEVIPVPQLEAALIAAGAPPDAATAVAADYGQSQLDGLRNALFAVAVFAVLSVWFTRRLPGESTAAPEPQPDAAAVAMPAT
jgi:EmrB/QacA subfamily drug resistance transporter